LSDQIVAFIRLQDQVQCCTFQQQFVEISQDYTLDPQLKLVRASSRRSVSHIRSLKKIENSDRKHIQQPRHHPRVAIKRSASPGREGGESDIPARGLNDVWDDLESENSSLLEFPLQYREKSVCRVKNGYSLRKRIQQPRHHPRVAIPLGIPRFSLVKNPDLVRLAIPRSLPYFSALVRIAIAGSDPARRRSDHWRTSSLVPAATAWCMVRTSAAACLRREAVMSLWARHRAARVTPLHRRPAPWLLACATASSYWPVCSTA